MYGGLSNMITNKVTINLNVFDVFMEDFIVSNIYDTFIAIKCNTTIKWISKNLKQSSKAHEFKSDVREGHVLWFSFIG